MPQIWPTIFLWARQIFSSIRYIGMYHSKRYGFAGIAERLLSIILWSKSGVVFEEPREEINVIVVFNLTWIKEKDKYYIIQAVSWGNFHELSPSALISK